MTHERLLGRLLSTRTATHDAVELAEWLYQRYFVGWTSDRARTADDAGSPWLVAELDAACEGASCWEPGFTLLEREGDGVLVSNASVMRVWANRGEVRPRAGNSVSLRVPCARPSALAGFFSFVSRAGPLDSRKAHLKLYVNATVRGAVAVMRELAQSPTLRRARFEAKCVHEPSQFGRRDTLLLYVDARDVGLVVRWLMSFMRGHRSQFRTPVPPLTFPLMAGLGIAESPLHHESFGAHRTRLIAEAVVTALREGSSWKQQVAERFQRERLEWARPWRGDDSPASAVLDVLVAS